jgi:protein MpaA
MIAMFPNSPLQTTLFGLSSQQLPIWLHRWGSSSGPHILVLGGVHGDEPEGVIAVSQIQAELLKTSPHWDLQISLVPEFNPEGVLRKTRQNSRGVDLNRNLPTQNWTSEAPGGIRYAPGPTPSSEPETVALLDFMRLQPVDLILSYHSYKPLVNPNGPAPQICQILAESSGYPIVEDMGYPHPGCLGTYAGLERGIPCITFEVERGLSFALIQERVVPGFMAAMALISQKRKIL